MKTRPLTLLLSLSLLLSLPLGLSGCNGGEAAPARTAEETAQAIFQAALFSETLETIDPDVAASVYGVDEAAILDCAAYLSTGATAEECVILLLSDADAAQAAVTGFQSRVEGQLAVLKDYQPQEVEKLESALYGSFETEKGTLAYLVVAVDPSGASEALGLS